MNKKEFEKFIKEGLKDLPVHKQEELLNKIQYNWLPDIKNRFAKKISSNDLLKCPQCGKYSSTKEYSISFERELVRGQLVYTDCGYGDDDKFADVLYDVEYLTCPCCKEKFEKRRHYISESNRKRRSD